MADSERSSNWLSSSASGGGNCLEVSVSDEQVNELVLMRNSRHPDGPFLRFTRDEWEAFKTGVRRGDFDRL